MTATLLPVPRARFFTASGAPLAGGKVYTYTAGTTTPKNTYTTAAGNITNANPVILDAAGEANIWLQGNYKIVLANSADVVQWTVDNVSGSQEVSIQWLTVTGTDTLIGTPESAVTSYTTQQIFLFYAENTNTTAVTINISGLGAKAITKNGATALVAGDIVQNAIVQINYDGTQFQMQTVPAGTYLNKAAGGAVTGQTSFSNITNTGLNILDTNASHTLGIIPGSDLTANRHLTINTGDANRALTLYGDSSLTGNNFGAIYSSIAGLLPASVSGNATTGAVTISSGQATDSAGSKTMIGAGFSWLVSNGAAANGYQGGTTLPNSSTIHFYVMAAPTDTTWTASFASTSLTPTLPGSYTLYRRVFSLPTNGSGALLAGNAKEVNGGALRYYLSTNVLDVDASVTTTGNLYTMSVPAGISVEIKIRGIIVTTGTGLIYLSGDETDAAPSNSAQPLADIYDDTFNMFGSNYLETNTSGQIRLRAYVGTTAARVNTRGWIDYRR